jgi:hypothetical protein
MSEQKMAEAPKVPESQPEKSGAPAGAKKKPRGLVRWGGVAIVLGGGAAFAFAGVGPVARWGIQKYGSAALGAPITVESAKFAPLTLTLTLEGVNAADKASRTADGKYERSAFSAKEVVGALDLGAMLRGRLVFDEVRVSGARGKAVRASDGTISFGGAESEPEPPPPGTAPGDPAWRRKLEEKAKGRDLVKDLKELLKRLKEKREEQAAKKKEEAERRRTQGIGDPDAAADWVREEQPFLVVKRLIADGVELEIADEAAGAPPASITNATLEVKNLSTAPSLVKDPLEVNASFDATPAALDAIFQKTIPLTFGARTRTSVRSSLSWKDWRLDWRPLLDLTDIQAKARDPNGKILGIDAQKFADALTEVGRVKLDDVHIFGEAWDPTVDTGETLKRVVVEALRAKGEKVAAEQLQKGLEKVTEKIDPDLKKKVEESPAGGLLKQGQEKLGEGLKGLGDSIFGGSKEKK